MWGLGGYENAGYLTWNICDNMWSSELTLKKDFDLSMGGFLAACGYP
jgi:hypothetical protein